MIDLESRTYGYVMKDGESPSGLHAHAGTLNGDIIAPFRIDPCFIESTISTVRTGMLRGVELSETLSMLAPSYVDILRSEARAVGAANTVYLDRDSNQLVGVNTLIETVSSLVLPHVAHLQHRMMLVFGTGYAARVAIWSLLGLCDMVCIVSRNPDSSNPGLQRMEAMLGNVVGGPRIETVDYGTAVTDPYDIVVNATPLGGGINKCSPSTLSPSLAGCTPRPGQVFVDFTVGRYATGFIPDTAGIAGIDGQEIASTASAMSYATMACLDMPSRVQLMASYADEARNMRRVKLQQENP